VKQSDVAWGGTQDLLNHFWLKSPLPERIAPMTGKHNEIGIGLWGFVENFVSGLAESHSNANDKSLVQKFRRESLEMSVSRARKLINNPTFG
jgi:hypothetical protein